MYVNPNIFRVDWDNLSGWTDGDVGGAISEIDPAGQLHLDCRAITIDGCAVRNKDLGSVGTGNYYVEMRFKGDTWGGFGGQAQGVYFLMGAETKRLNFFIGNGFENPSGNGIIVRSASSYALVVSKTWDNDWHTIVFYVHNSQTDVDIWVDKDPETEAADVTDADCSYATADEGDMKIKGWGTIAGNERYHIDYVYVGDELIQGENATFFGSNF